MTINLFYGDRRPRSSLGRLAGGKIGLSISTWWAAFAPDPELLLSRPTWPRKLRLDKTPPVDLTCYVLLACTSGLAQSHLPQAAFCRFAAGHRVRRRAHVHAGRIPQCPLR